MTKEELIAERNRIDAELQQFRLDDAQRFVGKFYRIIDSWSATERIRTVKICSTDGYLFHGVSFDDTDSPMVSFIFTADARDILAEITEDRFNTERQLFVDRILSA